MKRKYKYHLIKDNFTYTVKELPEAIKAHPRTIQICIRDEGLQVIDPSSKKFLIKGKDAKEFFRNRLKQQRYKLQYFEFNCMRCRRAVESVPDKIELIETGRKLGKDFLKVDIRGVCSICKGKLYKLSSNIKANQIKQYYKEKSETPSTMLEQLKMELI